MIFKYMSCYKAGFKAEVALAALTERQALAGLAAHYQLATLHVKQFQKPSPHLSWQVDTLFLKLL